MGISCLHTRLSFDELMSQCDDQYLMSIAIISGNLELVHVDATSGMIGEIRVRLLHRRTRTRAY
jgi:hypothetical protein